MKFTTSLFVVGAIVASVHSAPVRRASIDPALVPEFGIVAGTNARHGDCDGTIGPNGTPVAIPCACPPERNAFIEHLSADVAAGHAVNNPTVNIDFPTGDSVADQSARITAVLISLQNLNGPGQGCPAAATNLVAAQKALQDGTAASAAPASAAPASTPAASSTDSAPAAASSPISNASDDTAAAAGGVDPALVPDFGIVAGTNPSGTGDCDGTTGPDGKAVLIPCACPPERDSFIQHLSADVAAGHAVNNPTVNIDFPTGDSVADQSARITAVLISLQNLNGPGKGCPAAATNLVAAQKALQAGTSPAAPASAPASASAEPAAAASATDAAAPAASDAAASTNTATTSNSALVDASLVPDFGIVAGTGATGTGDCEGVTGPDGKPVLIPCACPPERDSFIQHLSADVGAGFAVNNPTVKISFPEDDSTQSQIDRISAVLISLQNLNGPGQGCPAAATTLVATRNQLAATL